MSAVEKVLLEMEAPRAPLLRRHAAPRPRVRPREPLAGAAGVRAEGRRPTRRSRSSGASRRSSTGWSTRIIGSGRPCRRGSRPVTASTAIGSSARADIGSFHQDRARLLESVGREAQRVVDTYDRRRESEAIANGARTAVATTAAVGAGALGLGALVSLAATTAAADITGFVMAGVMAALGFLIIPAKRRKAQGRDSREGLVAHRRPSDGARRRVRARPGRQRPALRRRHRPLHAVRARGTRAMGFPSLGAHRAPEPHQPVADTAPVLYLSLWISLRRTGCCP